ncbi:MAG TPA: glutathione S-transferase family protein [Rhodobacterales bacterium]|nr:glutathione S-transferase family protein [Rhodobacterales bacterium]
MKLIIGNKKYSSWSFRPWIAMRVKGIAFDEELIRFDFPAGNPAIKAATPAGKVPVLVDGDITVWESLAILEYLAERFPETRFWPTDIATRAKARALACEMHGGFGSLRNECPTNWARARGAIEVSDGVRRDVARIEQIWAEALDASGGPFLFGDFSNADAMFAPVVNRLDIYALSTHEAVARYSQAMKALPAWSEWEAAGRAEPWIVEEDEA